MPYTFPLINLLLYLKGLSHQIFKAFFMTYDIKSVLSAWAPIVFKFFHQVVILIF